MNQTRAELDRKLVELEQRAHELTPRAVARRILPEYALEYAIGGVLTLVGLRMALGMYRVRRRRLSTRRSQLRATLVAGRRWSH